MSNEQDLLEFLSEYLTDRRKMLIEEKLSHRTKHLTIILEDIYNRHNANAVVRSCECFGVQNLHVVEQRNEYDLSPNVLQGSLKWINLARYNNPDANNIQQCYSDLKASGYRIVATSPEPVNHSIAELDSTQPMALAFGTELNGLTDWAKEHADETVYIPMYGFTESFNISVGAALCMYELLNRIRKSEIEWQLSDSEKNKLRLDWYRKSVNRVDLLEQEFKRRSEKNK